MAQPTPYDRQTSFKLFSVENPDTPHSGTDLDAEYNAVKVALDETQANLALIQRDDGRLANASVGREQLDSSITIGFESPLPWAQSTSYVAGVSTVFYNAIFYTCKTTHTSSSVFDSSKWTLVADLSASAAIADGSITEAKLADGSVTAAKVATNAISSSKISASAVTTSKIADEAVTFAKLALAIPGELADAIIPAGITLDYYLPTLPTVGTWDWCDGGVILAGSSPVLRAALIAASYPYGQDGSGNPKKPDRRGRVGVGKDNMGGSAAGRVTSAGSSIDGVTLGATGGSQVMTILTTNLPAYTPSGSVSVAAPSLNAGLAYYGDVGNTGLTKTALLANSGNASGAANNAPVQAVTANAPSASFTGSAQGGASTATVNMQPSIVCNVIIKAH